VWDLPFIWPNDFAMVDKILENSPITTRLVAEAAKRRINILGFFENDWRGMTSNKKPVTQPEDLKGIKIRVVENKPSIDYFKRVGAIPTPMSWPDTYTALQQGTVDAQDNGAVINYGVKIWDVQKYYTPTRHIYSPTAVVISDAALAKISDADKAILKKLAVKVGREQRAFNRAMVEKYTKEMATKMKIYQLSAEGLKKFQEIAKGTYKEMEGMIGKDIIDLMLQESKSVQSKQSKSLKSKR
jgi:TRAP-type C4-dicarboxylate transport system substrate-binding protein